MWVNFRTKLKAKFLVVKGKEGEKSGSYVLGLTMCKEIVKIHGVDIWVGRTEEKGAYCTLKLV